MSSQISVQGQEPECSNWLHMSANNLYTIQLQIRGCSDSKLLQVCQCQWHSWVLKEQFLSPSELFGRECTHTHTHTHTYIRTYIHIPVLIVHRVNYYIIGGGVKEAVVPGLGKQSPPTEICTEMRVQADVVVLLADRVNELEHPPKKRVAGPHNSGSMLQETH